MVPSRMTTDTLNALAAAGFDGRIVSVRHIVEIEEMMAELVAKRQIDSTFYSERLTGFRFDSFRKLKAVKSVIVTAAAQPMVRVRFSYQGTDIETFVPPTYSYDTDKTAERLIRKVLDNYGGHLMDCALPVKSIAVRSGLAKYGRNNITYSDRFGSFFILRAFYSDVEPADDDWGEMKMPEKCVRCHACVSACKTGAIDKDRFLIHAERCLTFHNERRCPFPAWVENKWHNCLIGCMDCQLVCPLNKGKITVTEEAVMFDRNETREILDCIPKEEISRSTRMKIRMLNLLDDYQLLGRNLRVLVERGSGPQRQQVLAES